MSLDLRAAQHLETLRDENLLRRVPTISARRGVAYHLDGQPVVGFCSNDYLGLSAEHAGVAGATGAGASRLIAGDMPEHREVEARLADVFGSADAVLFPSGFQLNVGVIAALVRACDRVHSDRLNHASIIDGLRLSAARPVVLPHRQAPGAPTQPSHALRWWVTESIFSMDGDRLDVEALTAFQGAGGTTYVDEAHACGLFAGGAGLLGAAGVQPDVLVGTLSKAYGCAGAFVAASRNICELIRNRARSFVFSTGIAPAVAAAIGERLSDVAGPRGDTLRRRLWANAGHFQAALTGTTPDACRPASPIFPVLVGDNDTALTLAATLRDAGLHVQAIRPPTVPVGTARLRITVTAAHTTEQIERLADTLRRAMASLSIPMDLGVHAATARPANEPARPSASIR